MELKEIISITGRPGLFKVVAQGKNNVIVESIVDQKRFPAYAKDRISTLGDISIYTTDEDVKLTDVLSSFHDEYKGKECPSHKEDLSVLEGLLKKILNLLLGKETKRQTKFLLIKQKRCHQK